MENKSADVMAILKLYELRRDDEMRRARQWFFTEFNPQSAGDIAKLVISGERESAYYRTVTSYWNMACSFVNNGAIDEKLFADANTEHIIVYTKIQPFLQELRKMFSDPNYNAHLEKLVMKSANIEGKLEVNRRLFRHWAQDKQKSETD